MSELSEARGRREPAVPPTQNEQPAHAGRSPRTAIAVAAVVVLVALGVWWAVRDPMPKNDLERLQGEWVIQLPRDDEAEGGRSGPPLTVRVTGDRWAFVAGGEERSFFRVKLNEAAKAIELTRLTPDGHPASATNERGKPEAVGMRGVYDVDRKTLRVALAPFGQPAPTTLDAPHPVTVTMTRK